jgi:hypothetical protein
MANNHHIQDFISGFQGGTRTNRFRVTGNFQGLQQYGLSTPYHIRATTLPTAKIGVIPVSYRGRVVNYPGDRTYDPWVITVLDDSNGNLLYEAFHRWHEDINNHMGNISNGSATNLDGKVNFGKDITVEHLDTNGNTVHRGFNLKNAWPVEVGAVQLDIGQMDTMVSFQVTFTFTHYELKNFV